MTKIKLLSPLSGLDYSHKPGDIIEVGDDEAARHLVAGNAVAVTDTPIEQATVDTSPAAGVEQAVVPNGKARKSGK